MFYSFFGTCKKNDIDPQKWLTYVINHINDTKASQLKDLLPQFIDKNLLGLDGVAGVDTLASSFRAIGEINKPQIQCHVFGAYKQSSSIV